MQHIKLQTAQKLIRAPIEATL